MISISIQPGSYLAQRIHFNETGDEAKPKALLVVSFVHE